jgi:hypothetical protein
MASGTENLTMGSFSVTCHTDECGNKDIEISVQAYIPATVVCGVCGVEIEDVIEITTEAAE